jgi:GAF domain-containing protein
MDDELDVDSGLRELSSLLLAEETLESTMQRIAAVACRCVCAGAGATVTLLNGDEPYTAAATDDRVRAVDERQYELRDGPCVEALKTGETQVIANIGIDERFADVGPMACAVGLVSVMSVPLRTAAVVDGVGEVLGSLNVYADAEAAFGDDHVAAAELVAAQASVVTVNARTHAECHERIRQLQEALDSRVVIEQAKGMLMERHGVGPQEAFGLLRGTSQRQNRRMRLVAQDLVLLASGARASEDGARG